MLVTNLKNLRLTLFIQMIILGDLVIHRIPVYQDLSKSSLAILQALPTRLDVSRQRGTYITDLRT